MTAAVHAGPWVSAEIATAEVGVSRATLYRLRKMGVLKAGVHFIKTTPGKTGRVLWAPEQIRQAQARWTSVDICNRGRKAV